MGGDHAGGARFGELAEEAHHQPGRLRILVAGRLVGEEQVGPHHRGTRQGRPLLLAERDLGGRPPGQRAEGEHVEHRRGFGDRLLGSDAVETQREGDVLEQAQLGK